MLCVIPTNPQINEGSKYSSCFFSCKLGMTFCLHMVILLATRGNMLTRANCWMHRDSHRFLWRLNNRRQTLDVHFLSSLFLAAHAHSHYPSPLTDSHTPRWDMAMAGGRISKRLSTSWPKHEPVIQPHLLILPENLCQLQIKISVKWRRYFISLGWQFVSIESQQPQWQRQSQSSVKICLVFG